MTDAGNFTRENVPDHLRRIVYYGVSVVQSLGTARDDVEITIRNEQRTRTDPGVHALRLQGHRPRQRRARATVERSSPLEAIHEASNAELTGSVWVCGPRGFSLGSMHAVAQTSLRLSWWATAFPGLGRHHDSGPSTVGKDVPWGAS